MPRGQQALNFVQHFPMYTPLYAPVEPVFRMSTSNPPPVSVKPSKAATGCHSMADLDVSARRGAPAVVAFPVGVAQAFSLSQTSRSPNGQTKPIGALRVVGTSGRHFLRVGTGNMTISTRASNRNQANGCRSAPTLRRPRASHPGSSRSTPNSCVGLLAPAWGGMSTGIHVFLAVSTFQ